MPFSCKLSDVNLLYFARSDHVPAARECLASFLAASAPCLAEEERPGLNVTLDMVDTGLTFACHGDGDRIARELSLSYFMSAEALIFFTFSNASSI